MKTAARPHQVCQVGLVSTHELPLLADGHEPGVDCFVEILPDIILQVVSASEKKTNPSLVFKITSIITDLPKRSLKKQTHRFFKPFEMKNMAAAPTYLAKTPS